MAKILHFEDDADIRLVVQKILQKEGHKVVNESDTNLAVEKIAEIQPDLVLLDVMMDEVDSGLQVYETICQEYPQLPIIFLTSLGDQIMPYFQDNVMPWIVEKPITPGKIVSAVKQRLTLPVLT
jgi:CheY-like chemotaxis protein